MKNARKWREDLERTLNETNERIGLDERWDQRSYKERGLDILPTKHLGVKASALERKGIHTGIGDYNRRVIAHNNKIMEIAAMFKTAITDSANKVTEVVATSIKNVVTDLIDKVALKRGKLALPISEGMYLRRVTDRPSLQEPENAKAFVIENNINDFKELTAFHKEKADVCDNLDDDREAKNERIIVLNKRLEVWSRLEPLKAIHDESNSKKALSKIKYDYAHKTELEEYNKVYAEMVGMLPKGDKISPSEWKKEADNLSAEITKLNSEVVALSTELAMTEVIDYNRVDLPRFEERQKEKARKEKAALKKAEKQKEIVGEKNILSMEWHGL